MTRTTRAARSWWSRWICRLFWSWFFRSYFRTSV